MAVGTLGFWFHLTAVLAGPSADWFDNVIYVAPILAPLLFVNLALLALLGFWDLRTKVS